MAKREKVSCGRVLAWACVASASRSLELLPREIALKFNFRRLKLHRAIVMLNTAPPPPSPRPEGRVTPLCGLYWGMPLDRIRFLVSVPRHGIILCPSSPTGYSQYDRHSISFFCPKQGQGVKPAASPLHPNIGQNKNK